MEQLKVGTNDLPLVAKKKVAAAVASVSSTEAFLTVGLALQLEVPTAATTNIPGWKVGEKCWNSGLDGQLDAVAASMQLKAVAASFQLEEAVAATSETVWLQETLPTVSQMLDLYENHVT
jgi:hypothetical protein